MVMKKAELLADKLETRPEEKSAFRTGISVAPDGIWSFAQNLLLLLKKWRKFVNGFVEVI
jgi:hypothetical protein